jgi:hypothetical protein
MDRREFLYAVASTAALPVISPLPRPALITPGMPREAALQIFGEHYRLTFATPEAAEFFFPQVKSVSFLLADPLPVSQAAALEGVLQDRHGLRKVIDWLCVGRGETVEEYLPIAELERDKRKAEADANPNRVRFLNEHDCYWFPDNTRGGIFHTPREVVAFYSAYGDPNWRENLKEKPRTPEDDERDRRIEEVCRTGTDEDLANLLDEMYPAEAPHTVPEHPLPE